MVFELNKGVLNTLYAKITDTKGKNGIIAFNDDVNERERKYRSLKFVEFLEYLGRSANLKFADSSATLCEKIERLLDLILPTYGLKRAINQDKNDDGLDDDKDSVDYDLLSKTEGIDGN